MASYDVSAEMVHEDHLVFALNDINPRAPTHVLIVPREHIPSVRDLTLDHSRLLGHLFTTAAAIADEIGVSEKGYRLAFNVGDDGGQTIYHLHLHLLAGRRLGPEG